MRKRITKVTTKTGDDGTTAMADGSRVSKSEARINCIGEVDELNSLIGYLRSVDSSAKYDLSLMRIQNCLFDIGGSLSLGTDQSISQEEILYLEKRSIFLMVAFLSLKTLYCQEEVLHLHWLNMLDLYAEDVNVLWLGSKKK